MQLGMVGLGKMGANMVRRLMKGGHSCVVYDQKPESVAALVQEGASGASTLEEFVAKLKPPRAAWLMVPAGQITEQAAQGIGALMAREDVLIDGGNSFYKDDVRRAGELAKKGVYYLDVGTSGGVWGVDRGYCLMIGGAREAVDRLMPIFRTLAPGRGDVALTESREGKTGTPEEGFLHCGGPGAGHFVKMIHNGIEYGLMQAYAEGFDILKNADIEALPEDLRYTFNLPDIAEVWRRGSVIGSWLLDLSARALSQNPTLSNYQGYVSDSGEGRWTVNAAIEEAVPAEVLTAALYTRFRSRQEHTFAEKLLSAMRQQFGGHLEPGAPPPAAAKPSV